MKKVSRYILLLTLFVGCPSLVSPQDGKPQPKEIVTSRPYPEYFPNSWKEFSSEEGRFTILFPGVPAKNSHKLDTPHGKIEEHSFILKTFGYYGVAYSDFPENGIKDVNKFFTGFRVGYLKNTQARLLEEKNDDRFASPGRSLRTMIQGGHVNLVRLHLIGNRLYVLSTVMPAEDVDSETRTFYETSAMKFLNSFSPKIDRRSAKTDRFGDPPVRAPGLPAKGISVDPALASDLPYSRDGKPRPYAKINAGILNGKALSLPEPDYPPDAKAAGVSGEVKVKIVIDEAGNVIWTNAISGPNLLLKVSEEAASKAKFKPTTLGGEAVKVMGILIYKFASLVEAGEVK